MIGSSVLGRLIQPGTLYNIGNVVGFEAGLVTAVLAKRTANELGQPWWQLAWTYLAGSPATVALSLATVIFYWGGVVYDRAWEHGAPPDPRLNRQGDILSALGAITMAAGLIMIGNPWLALFAGGMHAGGKFGSAFAGSTALEMLGRKMLLQDACKDVVLLSRIPAILAAIGGYWQGGDKALPMIGSIVACYLIWGTADGILLSPNGFIRSGLSRRDHDGHAV